MQNEPIGRACFVCTSTGGVRMFDQDLEVCGLGRVGYAVRCCQDCGLVLQDPAVSPKTMQRQYAMFSNYLAFGGGDPPMSPTAARMLECVSNAQITPGHVYDVGAAAGFMLWHFRARGWSTGGCDPTPAAVAQAKARYGLDLDTGPCEQTLPDQSDLDLVTMSHVLEHIYDPVLALRAVHAALADGGHLLIEVPCLTAPELSGPSLFMMEHINYFERTSLENLLGAVGFELVQTTVTLESFPFPVITVLARKADGAAPAAQVNAFADNLRFLQTYDRFATGWWEAIEARLTAAIAKGEDVCVWGAGLNTSTLLDRTSLDRHANIIAMTDRDSQKHGRTLGAYTVVEPNVVLESGRKIVVSSYVSEQAIVESLLNEGVAAERIVRLFS